MMTDDDIADFLEGTKFDCACGKRKIWLTELDTDDIISWLRYKSPMYHMGMLGCCESLRCYNCEDMPSECDCGEYLEWDRGVALHGEPE